MIRKKDSHTADVILPALLSLNHRGPDEQGTYISDEVCLGSCRLAIRGGIEGQQPVKSRSGNLILVFNGEIYNTESLKRKYEIVLNELESKSDSRFLAEFIEKFSFTKLAELDGAFAFAAFNLSKKCVLIARDRFGQVPIFFSKANSNLFFASEIEPLFKLQPNQRKSVDENSIKEYFLFQNQLNGNTLFKNISELLPGNYIFYDLVSSSVTQSAFWRHAYEESPIILEKINETLARGIQSQVQIENNEIGAMLSGGVDSSLIALNISRFYLPGNVKFFHVHYPEESSHEYNEFDYAYEFAKGLGLNFKPIPYTYNSWVQDIEATCKALEQPRMGQSCINYSVFKHAKGNCKVIVSGAGADEMFGGYPWRYPLEIKNNRVVPLSGVDYLSLESDKMLKGISSNEFIKLFPEFSLRNLNEFKNDRVQDVLKRIDFDESAPWGKVTKYLAFDLLTFLPGLLAVDDRLAMHNSIEVRSPFLSNAIYELALSMSAEQLFSIRGNSIYGKKPLRQALSDLGFSSVATRRKRGFSSPDGKWLSRFLENEGENLLKNSNTIWDFINKSSFIEIYEQHKARNNKRSFMWSFVATSFFLQNVS